MKRALRTCAYRLFPRFDRVEAAWGILHDEPTIYNVTIQAGRDVMLTGISFYYRGIPPEGVTLLESGGTVRGTTLTGWKNGKRNGEIALKFPPRAPVYKNIPNDVSYGGTTVSGHYGPVVPRMESSTFLHDAIMDWHADNADASLWHPDDVKMLARYLRDRLNERTGNVAQ